MRESEILRAYAHALAKSASPELAAIIMDETERYIQELGENNEPPERPVNEKESD